MSGGTAPRTNLAALRAAVSRLPMTDAAAVMQEAAMRVGMLHAADIALHCAQTARGQDNALLEEHLIWFSERLRSLSLGGPYD